MNQSSINRNRVKDGVLVTAVLSLIGVALYGYGFGIDRYYDDFCMYFEHPGRQIYSLFFEPNETNAFYRPITTALYCAVQLATGDKVFLIHLLNLLLHVSLGVLVFFGAQKCGCGKRVAWIAAVFFSISQINGFALLSNDTFSQLLVALFGYASVFFGFVYVYGPQAAARPAPVSPFYYLTIVAYGLGLFSKEAGLSFLLCHSVLAIVSIRLTKGKTFGSAVTLMVPLGVVTVAYLIVYFSVATIQPRIGEDTYSFQIGPGIIKNALMLLIASLHAGSIAALFEHIGMHDWAGIVGALLPTVLFIGFLVFFFFRGGNKKKILLLLLLTLLATVPIVAIRHVSELYVYNLMPLMSLTVAIILEDAIKALKRFKQTTVMLTIVPVIVIFVFLHIQAIYHNTASMYAVVARSKSTTQRIIPLAQHLKPGDSLSLICGRNCRVPYSIFSLSAGIALEDVAIRMQWHTQRGVVIVVADSVESIGLKSNPHHLVVAVRDCDGGVTIKE
jgi:hypothetical protein